MRRAIVVSILCGSSARADDVLTIRAHGEDAERFLHLDPALESELETPLATAEHVEARFDLAKATSALLANEAWIDDTSLARGTTASLRVSHDFGFARVVVSGSSSRVDSRFGHAKYIDLGVALIKTLHISRWTTAWLSIGLEYRSFYEPVDQGPTSGYALMARIGFTFR